MTDESTTRNDPSRSTQTTPPSKPGFGDPARHDFGDKTDRKGPSADPTETTDKDLNDAGEGHKGPRVDATRANPAVPRAESDKTGR